MPPSSDADAAQPESEKTKGGGAKAHHTGDHSPLISFISAAVSGVLAFRVQRFIVAIAAWWSAAVDHLLEHRGSRPQRVLRNSADEQLSADGLSIQPACSSSPARANTMQRRAACIRKPSMQKRG